MADTPKHSVSVAGIVLDDQDRVLVIQRRDNGHWEPPGGILELEETPEQGVVREIFEETGYSVHAESLTGIYKNMSRAVVALVFKCRVVEGTASTSSETRTVRWMGLLETDEHMLPAYAVRVRDAFRDGVAVRCHDGEHLLDSLGCLPVDANGSHLT